MTYELGETVKILKALALAFAVALTVTACTSADAKQLEDQYGVSGAYNQAIATPDGR